MTKSRTPARRARAPRSAAVLVAVVALVGLLPAIAGAATPPPPTDPPSKGAAAESKSTTPRPAAHAHHPVTTAAAPTSAPPSATAPTSAAVVAPPSATALRSATATAPPAVAAGAERGQVAVLPGTQTVREGQKAVFTATYTRTSTPRSPQRSPQRSTQPDPTTSDPVTIRWQTATGPNGPWTDIAGPGGTVLESTATLGMDGTRFRAEASNAATSWRSPPVILRVQPSPTQSLPAAGAYYGTVEHPVIDLGQEQSATGHNFTPGTLVKVTLEPDGRDLGTATVAPDGTVTTRFATTGLLAGPHTVTWTPPPVGTASPSPSPSPLRVRR